MPLSPCAASMRRFAAAHGIEPAAGVDVLNVSVYRSDRAQVQPLPAEVQASVTDLAGVRQQIVMKPARARGDVSYFGSFRFRPDEANDFEIAARPAGSDAQLTLRYQDSLRFAVDSGAADRSGAAATSSR